MDGTTFENPGMVATLLKELVQNQSYCPVIPYNDECVRLSIDEIKNIFDEFNHCRLSLERERNNISTKAKAYILRTQLQRHKRILMAYHMDRLLKLSRKIIETTDFAQNSLDSLSKYETKFYHIHADNIVKYKSSLGHQLNIFGPIIPPKEFYIQVRVEKDCGAIQTEYGQVTLNHGTVHFLKRNDVEHLIVRGYLIHLI